MDIVSGETRSRMMSGIRGKNTKPELLIRSGLHKTGIRFTLHSKHLPGKPDIVFPKYKAVIFTHGCFWHRHDCHLFKWPSTRKEFWKQKINGNVTVDRRNIAALKKEGWRVAVVWECAIKGRNIHRLPTVISKCRGWLLSKKSYLELRENE